MPDIGTDADDSEFVTDVGDDIDTATSEEALISELETQDSISEELTVGPTEISSNTSDAETTTLDSGDAEPATEHEEVDGEVATDSQGVDSEIAAADAETIDDLPGTDCRDQLNSLGIEFTVSASPNEHPVGGDPNDVCQIVDPILVTPTIDSVTFYRGSYSNAPTPMLVACPTALALYNTVQIAKPRGITAFLLGRTYECQYDVGTSTLPPYAFGDAIDLNGIRTTTGSEYAVGEDWGVCGETAGNLAAETLRGLIQELHDRQVWSIILTPEYSHAFADRIRLDATPGSDFISACE